MLNGKESGYLTQLHFHTLIFQAHVLHFGRVEPAFVPFTSRSLTTAAFQIWSGSVWAYGEACLHEVHSEARHHHIPATAFRQCTLRQTRTCRKRGLAHPVEPAPEQQAAIHAHHGCGCNTLHTHNTNLRTAIILEGLSLYRQTTCLSCSIKIAKSRNFTMFVWLLITCIYT